MGGNSFGHTFVVTTAGESHGPAEIAIIDGCPAGLELAAEDFERDLSRRRPGQSSLVSQRREPDVVEILSGTFEGVTTGTSIALEIRNADARSKDYDANKDRFRPGHADHTYLAKYGVRDHRGGGRASARETVTRVAAAVIAKKLLATVGVQIVGWVDRVGDVQATIVDPESLTVDDVESNAVRCPDPVAAQKMIEQIELVRNERDSIGGVAKFIATGVAAGWGEPVFDKLKADLAKGLFSLPAVVGVEYGAGFAATRMRGSEHNDRYTTSAGAVVTTTNHHGGILGGISTGMPIRLTVGVKPTSSVPQPMDTVRTDGTADTVTTTGRHDPCLLPRFVPMGEAMIALVLVDHWLRHRTSR